MVELDGLTGEKRSDGKAVRQQLQGAITKELLFDIGVDTVDLIVPGGGIAVKLARAVVGASRNTIKGETRLPRRE